MTEELINTDGLGTALVYIADKIGITVEQMYHIYVSAQFTMAVTQIVFILIWAVSTIIILKIAYDRNKGDLKDTSHFGNNDSAILKVFICTAVGSAFIGSILLFLYGPVIAIFCPDYMALQSLMEDIGKIASILK